YFPGGFLAAGSSGIAGTSGLSGLGAAARRTAFLPCFISFLAGRSSGVLVVPAAWLLGMAALPLSSVDGLGSGGLALAVCARTAPDKASASTLMKMKVFTVCLP